MDLQMMKEVNLVKDLYENSQINAHNASEISVRTNIDLVYVTDTSGKVEICNDNKAIGINL